MGQLEYRDRLHQILGLTVQTGSSGSHLFDQGCILLGGLVHLRHRFAHLGHTGALLGAGGTDFAHDVGHAADAADHFIHRGASLVYQGCALFHTLHAGRDEVFDFLGRFGRATRQAAHFAGHYRKATALLACAGCFYGRIQSQNVGLEGNAVNHADDVGNLVARFADALHGVNHLGDHLTTLHRHVGGVLGQLIGLFGVVGILLDGGAQLFH